MTKCSPGCGCLDCVQDELHAKAMASKPGYSADFKRLSAKADAIAPFEALKTAPAYRPLSEITRKLVPLDWKLRGIPYV